MLLLNEEKVEQKEKRCQWRPVLPEPLGDSRTEGQGLQIYPSSEPQE